MIKHGYAKDPVWIDERLGACLATCPIYSDMLLWDGNGDGDGNFTTKYKMRYFQILIHCWPKVRCTFTIEIKIKFTVHHLAFNVL